MGEFTKSDVYYHRDRESMTYGIWWLELIAKEVERMFEMKGDLTSTGSRRQARRWRDSREQKANDLWVAIDGILEKTHQDGICDSVTMYVKNVLGTEEMALKCYVVIR